MRKVARNVVDPPKEILIDSERLKQARELKPDVSRAAEDGIAKADKHHDDIVIALDMPFQGF